MNNCHKCKCELSESPVTYGQDGYGNILCNLCYTVGHHPNFVKQRHEDLVRDIPPLPSDTVTDCPCGWTGAPRLVCPMCDTVRDSLEPNPLTLPKMPSAGDVSPEEPADKVARTSTDAVKLRYGLLLNLHNAFAEMANGWTSGQSKYDDEHWRKLSKDDSVDKIMRHLMQYLSGEDIDEEMGAHHLAAVANNTMILLEKELTK